MLPKQYFAYIRVSTVRQGQLGTSLVEQRSAIQRHARQRGIRVIKEFQEQETAAKGGRPIFRQMMQALQEGKARGLVMHKIDRGARNLKDWAELGELIDAGVEVHFANENLDMDSRGGRLSADIQAVVAADYIRNLREEVKKGFYGRIKQGFYPMPAPIGYLDKGGGKTKAIDPVNGPLVQQAFELYATCKHSLDSLATKMNSLGLRRKSGQAISANGVAHILHNLFYTGIIRLHISEEYFAGRHQPLVTKLLFDQVQLALEQRLSKINRRNSLREAFLFRRLLFCKSCGHHLIGELQKGHIYYRCHTRSCPQKTIREERVRKTVWSTIRRLEPDPIGKDQVKDWLSTRRQHMGQQITDKRKDLLHRHVETQRSLDRLTDAFVSDALDRSTYLNRKNGLVAGEIELKETLANLETTEHENLHEFEEAFEYVQSAGLTFMYGSYQRKRDVITTITARLEANRKSVAIRLRDPFEMILSHIKKRPDRASN